MRSRLAYILCVSVLCYTAFFFHARYEKTGMATVLTYDVQGYYSYLPAIFIYKDLKHLNFLDSIDRKYHAGLQDNVKTPEGNFVIKYPAGMACVYFPFFITADAFAEPLGYAADGFSKPYQFAIHLGGLLVSLLGLWYLRKLLLIFYSDTVVAITLLLLAFGSNYLVYAANDPGMSHCWLFTIYVFILLNSHYFYSRPSYKYAVRIGLLTGLATLIRPTEIISVLIPLLWGFEKMNKAALMERLRLFKTNGKMLGLALVCFTGVMFIQLAYWKYVSGHWFVYSYKDQGFSFLSPHVQKYMFSYLSGWLTYTPVMYFAILGIIPFVVNRAHKNRIAIIGFFIVSLYIVSAWDIWWYGGRAMVQSYPVLLFPFAASIEWMLAAMWRKWVLLFLSLLFVYYNIWYMYQRHYGGLYNMDCNTEEYFWRVVGRWQAPEETLKLLDTDELFEGEPRNMQLLYQNNFDDDTSIHSPYLAIDGVRSQYVDKEHQQTPVYNIPFSAAGADWIRAKATFYSKQKQWDLWRMSQFFVQFSYRGIIVKDRSLRVYRFMNDEQTRDIYIDIKIPHEQFDSVGVRLYHSNNDLPLVMDKLEISSFNE